MESEALPSHDHGVARVGAAVVSDDGGVPGGEDVDDFAFALVAPLEADDRGATRLDG